MSVETPQVVEAAPVVTKPVEATTTPNEVSAPIPSEPVTEKPITETPATATETPAVAEPAKDETVVEATPATEGVLGYKAPGLLKQFRFVKHFFWFSEEPITQEAVDAYVKSEKVEVAHHNAAWAQETGKGVLFYAKRAEDKATPSGLILLHEASAITKVGTTDFSFKIGSHTHKFEAATAAERDSWVVAVTKFAAESKDMKAEITGRESYKKTIEGFAFSPIIAGSAAHTPVKNGTPKKSLDMNTATATSAAEPAAEAEPVAAVDEVQKTKDAEKQAKKERSQSRKRNSVFGLFAKKEEDKEKELKKEEKKAEKEHEKAEKKAEKEHIKEEKKIEAEQKKEEAKAEHDATKAKEAAEAAIVAAVPAAAIAAEKKEEKHEDKTEEAVSPTDKKSKRSSVFGSFFAKHKLTSPSAEKSEKEGGLAAAATHEDTPAVAEVAPKLDEPIETKPIDAAAVTAPVDAAATETVAPAAVVPATEEVKSVEPATSTDATVAPKAEKKNFLAGFINKKEKKEETKSEKPTEEVTPVVAPVAATTTEPLATDGAVDTVAKDTETAKEERPAREKRRTSLFGSLGTLKRKNDKSPEPSSVAASEELKTSEVKREKSPLPSKLGGLFRKPSRAAKTELATEEAKTDATADATTAAATETTATEAEAAKTAEIPMTTETPATTTVIEPTESKIVGDVVPDELHTTIHDAVTTTPAEVKATA